MNDYRAAAGPTADRLRRLGLSSGVGGPVSVDGRTWGALVVGSTRPEPMPPETESRVMDFADLVGTAIFNAETQAELTASRVRIVTAADQARRRFERDLHDGAQQRIVSLGLELRAIEATAPPESVELHDQLTHVVDGLSGLYADLQELSRESTRPSCRGADWSGHQDPRPPLACPGRPPARRRRAHSRIR